MNIYAPISKRKRLKDWVTISSVIGFILETDYLRL